MQNNDIFKPFIIISHIHFGFLMIIFKLRPSFGSKSMFVFSPNRANPAVVKEASEETVYSQKRLPCWIII